MTDGYFLPELFPTEPRLVPGAGVVDDRIEPGRQGLVR
jgi:hypothetical protein